MFDGKLLMRLLGDEKLAGSVGYTSIQFQSFQPFQLDNAVPNIPGFGRFKSHGKANSASRFHVSAIPETWSPMGEPVGRNPD